MWNVMRLYGNGGRLLQVVKSLCMDSKACVKIGNEGTGARLNGELLEEVVQFKYLGSVVAAKGEVEADVRWEVNEEGKMLGAVKGVVENRWLRMNVKRVLYEKVIVLTVMYGSEL
ncbi:uncharacterized protein [Palaemon carinicauda]|uniref:uncharacterized protein n=1 Tax=Palaemon carinicauda TaxID=392227 RepID=UPI0035B57097